MEITFVFTVIALTVSAASFAQAAAQVNAEQLGATASAAWAQARVAARGKGTRKPATNTGHQMELL